MPVIDSTVIGINIHEEEGGIDWLLALSKLGLFIIFLLTPLSIFRFVNDFFGIIVAGISVFLFLIVLRLIGPFNLVMLDEIICRIFPSFRTAFRAGRVRVYDFRVKTKEGKQVGCIMRGDLQGQIPAQGDQVRLNGTYCRGTLHVENGYNITTNAVFSRREGHTGLLLILSICLVTVLGLYLGGKFDDLLYPLVEKLLTKFLNGG